jgi:regulator of replication initiation timing
MQPINTTERKKAFGGFLIFYLITTALIITAVCFGVQVPFKQNEKLKDQIGTFEKQKAFSESFSTEIADLKRQLDSVNRAGVQAELVDGKISEKLKRLNGMVDNDSTVDKKLYQDQVQAYVDLQFAKKQLRDASGKDANLSQYLQQIEMLKSDLNQARSESNALRLQIMSMQRQ